MIRFNDLVVFVPTESAVNDHDAGAPYLYKGTFRGSVNLKRTTWVDKSLNSAQYQTHLGTTSFDLSVSFDYFKENFSQLENKV